MNEEKELSKEELLAVKLGRFRASFETACKVSRPDEFQVKMNNLVLCFADWMIEAMESEEEKEPVETVFSSVFSEEERANTEKLLAQTEENLIKYKKALEEFDNAK